MAPIDLITTPSEYQSKLEQAKKEECSLDCILDASRGMGEPYPSIGLVENKDKDLEPAICKVVPMDDFTRGKSYIHDIPELERVRNNKCISGQTTHEEKKDFALTHLMKLYELIEYSPQFPHPQSKGIEQYLASYKKELLLQIKRYIKECL